MVIQILHLIITIIWQKCNCISHLIDDSGNELKIHEEIREEFKKYFQHSEFSYSVTQSLNLPPFRNI